MRRAHSRKSCSDCASELCIMKVPGFPPFFEGCKTFDFCIMSSHVPVWFRQLPYSTLKDILIEYVTRSILVSCASRAARSLSSIDVPTIMPAHGASPARFFLTKPIYLDNCSSKEHRLGKECVSTCRTICTQ